MFARTIGLCQQAISEEPEYGEPYAALAMAHGLNWQNHWTDDWSRSLNEGVRLVESAVAKSPENAYVRYVAAVMCIWTGQLDRCTAEAHAALRLSPNYAPALGTLGLGLIYAGEPLAAIPHIERAIRLDPIMRHQYVHFLGSAYLFAGEFMEAAAQLRERIRLKPDTDLSRAFLAVALGHLQDLTEAQRVWRELEELNPKYSFAEHVGRLPLRREADRNRLYEGLRKAGISA